jgi:HD-like signal output (HDOD) protein
MRAATEIVALRQAIARLGMNRIREIAIAAALAGALFKQTRHQSEARQPWSALRAKEVARACRKNTEMAYLCGLLHNVGTRVVLNALEQATSQSLPSRDIATLLAEFGAQAGALLAQEWRLPEMVATTIRCVAAFHTAGAQIDAVAVVNTALHMSASMLRGELSNESVAELESTRHLNLYPDDVAALLALRDFVSGALEALAV